MASRPITLEELEIPRASAQAAHVLDMLSEADPDLPALEQALMGDPVLAGELLRHANSPLFRRASEVTNVPAAVRLLGLKNVRSAIVMSTLNRALPVDSPMARELLDHLVSVATVCKQVALRCCRSKVDDLALLGLLHDVGMIVLATNFEDSYAALRQRSQEESLPLDVLEAEAYGISHDQIAERVCRAFRLPARFHELLAGLHSHPARLTGAEPEEWCVLQLAHYLLMETTLPGSGIIETQPVAREALVDALGLSAGDLDDILLAIREQG